jgi:formylglycine-generating enzyme required for sulfatase activity
MSHILEQSTLRILTPEGQTVGAGFIVAPGLAVTCAHVVAAAKSGPGQALGVAAYSNGTELRATVSEQGWSPSEADDVAFVRLEGEGTGLVPLTLSAAGGRLRRPFAALGFPPEKAYAASWAQGILAEVVAAPGRAGVLQFQGEEIRAGMSGAALLDANADQVIGMVSEYRDEGGNRRAYAVTAETIWDASRAAFELVPPALEAPVERLLAQFLAVLREAGSGIQVGRDIRDTFLVVGSNNLVCLTQADLDRFTRSAPTSGASPEEIYLARFILNTTYARWEREYVPLAGSLTAATAPVMRLRHAADPGIGQAGLPLHDIREALTLHAKSRLVILGDPGAGKSTTLYRLALDLARRRLSDPGAEKLPLWINLFEFSDANPDPDAFLQRRWEAECGFGVEYAQAVNRGQVCFLLDGLNQMPFEDRQDRFDRWSAWAQRLPPGNWVIFTCRGADYLPVLGLPEVHVQSLDRGRIHQYLEIRFGVEQATEKWKEFESCLQSADDRFERMVSNPLMLSLLVQRAASGTPLTDNRAELMCDLAEQRLLHELAFGRQPDELRADVKAAVTQTTHALERLAYAMQRARGEGTSFKVEFARQILTDKWPDWVDLLKLAGDAGLIQPRFVPDAPDVNYAFAHHLFQEYFAAGELLARYRAGENLSELWRVPWQFPLRRSKPTQPLEPPAVTGWEETTLMAAARQGESEMQAFVKAVARANLPLAGRVLATARGADFEFNLAHLRQPAADLRRDLLARQRSPWVHLRARIAAGLALGELGHPDLRPQSFAFEGRTVWAIPPCLEAIPAGPFLIGSNFDDKHAYSDEKTRQRQINLSAFSMGCYPVTNAEYRFFIAAGGYNDRRWWSEAGWTWRQGGLEAHREAMEDWLEYRKWAQQKDLVQLSKEWNWSPANLRFWQRMVKLDETEAHAQAAQLFDRPFDRPAYWDDSALSAPARPVIGVNWHEAEAYCAWLSAVSGQVVRLPLEAEWEKAARGTAGVDYPWGERFDPNRCNTVESWIGATTPVGLYPNGKSPFQIWDASGNVWEWTVSEYRAYPGGDENASKDFGERFCVVRGGSWDYDRGVARCAYRLRYTRADFGSFIGFRVLSPGAS